MILGYESAVQNSPEELGHRQYIHILECSLFPAPRPEPEVAVTTLTAAHMGQREQYKRHSPLMTSGLPDLPLKGENGATWIAFSLVEVRFAVRKHSCGSRLALSVLPGATQISHGPCCIPNLAGSDLCHFPCSPVHFIFHLHVDWQK